jgi:hypothetical protein
MNADPDRMARNARIACALHNDPRLIAGVAAAVAHVARRAGLPERAEADISTAAAEACRETFLLLDCQRGPAPTIHLLIADFSDRVEVTLESSEKISKVLEGDLVDRVECETRDGRSRMTLVKYCDAAKSRPKA